MAKSVAVPNLDIEVLRSAISGALTTIMLAGSFIGAPVAGWVFDTLGSYRFAWLGGLGISIAALIVILTMPRSIKG